MLSWTHLQLILYYFLERVWLSRGVKFSCMRNRQLPARSTVNPTGTYMAFVKPTVQSIQISESIECSYLNFLHSYSKSYLSVVKESRREFISGPNRSLCQSRHYHLQYVQRVTETLLMTWNNGYLTIKNGWMRNCLNMVSNFFFLLREYVRMINSFTWCRY